MYVIARHPGSGHGWLESLAALCAAEVGGGAAGGVCNPIPSFQKGRKKSQKRQRNSEWDMCIFTKLQ